jgi:DNA-binding response OmpR family regulator
MGQRITFVEDDTEIGRSVQAALRSAGFDVTWMGEGLAATESITSAPPDLLVLDLGLPDLDGLTLCRWARERHPSLPIVVLTARDAEIDIVAGLDAGATDYVTKPFSTTVLLARLRAHLRTSSVVDRDGPVIVGSLTVEPTAYIARVGGEPVELRPREFELLRVLAREAGQVVTREDLLAEVWDRHWESSSKTLDMHVLALRRKLPGVIEITAVRGVGFRLDPV